MKITPISSKSFMADRPSSPATGSYDALLMLQDPKSAVIFEKNKSDAKKANSDNPITSLGYKLYRTFRYITNTTYATQVIENSKDGEKFVAVA